MSIKSLTDPTGDLTIYCKEVVAQETDGILIISNNPANYEFVNGTGSAQLSITPGSIGSIQYSIEYTTYEPRQIKRSISLKIFNLEVLSTGTFKFILEGLDDKKIPFEGTTLISTFRLVGVNDLGLVGVDDDASKTSSQITLDAPATGIKNFHAICEDVFTDVS